MQHEGSHEVNALLVAPTTDFTGGHHELDPMSLIREFGVLPLLVPARGRERGSVELVGAVADAPSGGERGAERRVDDDGAATEEGEPTCDDVEFPQVVGRDAGHGEVAEAGARSNLHGGTARFPAQLCDCELESLPAPRQATGRVAREEVVAPRV